MVLLAAHTAALEGGPRRGSTGKSVRKGTVQPAGDKHALKVKNGPGVLYRVRRR
jgi:hypothetical protein